MMVRNGAAVAVMALGAALGLLLWAGSPAEAAGTAPGAVALAEVPATMEEPAAAGAGVPVTAEQDTRQEMRQETFTFMAGEEFSVPETWTADGEEWSLVQVSDAVADPTFAPEERVFAFADVQTFATEEEGQAAFPETWPIAEAGFLGEIPRTRYEVRELTTERSWVVDRVNTYGPYPTNDVAQLPASARQDGVSWEVTEVSSLGVPVAYVATVTTKVEVVESRVVGYEVAAEYEGTLVKDEQRMMVTATYTRSVAPVPEVVSVGRIRGEGFPVGAVAGGGAALALFGMVFFLRSRNVVVCEDDGAAGEEGPARARVLAKVHASRKADGLQVTLPARVRTDRDLALYLRKDLCDGGALRVTQAGVEVFAGQAQRCVRVPAQVAGVAWQPGESGFARAQL